MSFPEPFCIARNVREGAELAEPIEMDSGKVKREGGDWYAKRRRHRPDRTRSRNRQAYGIINSNVLTAGHEHRA